MAQTVWALYDFEAEAADEISFTKGEPIEVLIKDDIYTDGWWEGRNVRRKVGLFPKNYTSEVTPSTLWAVHDFTAESPDEISFKKGESLVPTQSDEQFNDGWWVGKTVRGETGLFPVNYTKAKDLVASTSGTPAIATASTARPTRSINTAVVASTPTEASGSSPVSPPPVSSTPVVASMTAQTFRSINSTGVVFTININPRNDSKLGQKVVLWNDVQRVFKRVQFIMDGDVAVSFLTDDNFEDLIPLRIGFQPGVVLDVILEGSVSSPAPENSPRTSAASAVSPPLPPPSYSTAVQNLVDLGDHEQEQGVGPTPSPSPAPKPLISRHSSVISRPRNSQNSTSNFDSTKSSTGLRHPQDRSTTSTIITSTTTYAPDTTDSKHQPAQSTVRGPAAILADSLSEIYLGEPSAPPRRTLSSLQNSRNTNTSPTSTSISAATIYQIPAVAYKPSPQEFHYQTTPTSSIPQATLPDGSRIVQGFEGMVFKKQTGVNSGGHKKQTSSQQPKPLQESMRDEPTEAVNKMINSVMDLRYRLISASCPRHYIVLPNRSCLYDDKIVPDYDTFRLFFLCDCGKQGVHVAPHAGYDIRHPAEFFEEFGAYTLVMMRFLKYRILRNSTSKVEVNGELFLSPVQDLAQRLELGPELIEHYINLVISFLQKDLLEKEDASIAQKDIHEDGSPFLGSDLLKKLHRCLLDPDEGPKRGQSAAIALDTSAGKSHNATAQVDPVIANLQRAVDQEGYIHWVCSPHFQERFPNLAWQKVNLWCQAHKGRYDTQWNALTAECNIATVNYTSIDTSVHHQLSNFNGIVSITLNFVGHQPFMVLFNLGTTLANVRPIEIKFNFEAGAFTTPDMTVGYMDPILHLLTNGSTESFSYLGRTGGLMLERTATQLALRRAPKLRYLKWSIDSIEVEECMAAKQGLFKLLQLSDNLEELWIDWYWVEKVMSVILLAKTISMKLWLLTKLTIYARDLEGTFTVKDGQLQQLSVRVTNLDRYHDALNSGMLTSLVITERVYLSRPATKVLIGEIIRRNPCLETIELECWSGDFDTTENVIRTCNGGSLEVPHPTLKTLRVHSKGEGGNAFFCAFDLTQKQSPDATSMEVTVKEQDEDLDIIFLGYGASITKMVTGDGYAAYQLDHLDAAAGRPTTRLTHVDLAIKPLGDNSIKVLQSLLDRSPNLQVFRLECSNLGGPLTRNRAVRMVTKYRTRITSLTLSGAGEEFWVEVFCQLLPSLESLPKATLVSIQSEKNPKLTEVQLEWIEKMQLPPITPKKS
ncbi:polar growth protein [Podila humilis]|nr:polar growth protein [Podila humilis]